MLAISNLGKRIAALPPETANPTKHKSIAGLAQGG
jgi:hypothetical protein